SSSALHAPPPAGLYPLSLHDALPISAPRPRGRPRHAAAAGGVPRGTGGSPACPAPAADDRPRGDRRGHPDLVRVVGLPLVLLHPDRKSTRLNSSHVKISYAVFCLKKK